MKTLLVLAAHPDFAEAIRAGLNPEQYRIIHRTDLEEAEPLLAHGLAEACIVDVELTSVQGVWFLEKLRRRAPKCPVIIYTGAKQWEWEEEAYLQGATHVLTKPVRARMLARLLDRLWEPRRPGLPPCRPPASRCTAKSAGRRPSRLAAPARRLQSLGVLRDFSGILTHSLNAEGMLKQFLLLLREIDQHQSRGGIPAPSRSPGFGERSRRGRKPPVARGLRHRFVPGLAGAFRAVLRGRHRRTHLPPGPHPAALQRGGAQ